MKINELISRLNEVPMSKRDFEINVRGVDLSKPFCVDSVEPLDKRFEHGKNNILTIVFTDKLYQTIKTAIEEQSATWLDSTNLIWEIYNFCDGECDGDYVSPCDLKFFPNIKQYLMYRYKDDSELLIDILTSSMNDLHDAEDIHEELLRDDTVKLSNGSYVTLL